MGQFSLLSAMSVCLSVSAIQNFLSFWSYPSVDQPKVDNGGVRRAGSVDMWQVTRDRYRMTFFLLLSFLNNFFLNKVPKSVNKREFHSICNSWEIWCLPYAAFSSNRPTGPIPSSSRNVRVSACVCVCPFSCTRFWGLSCPHFPKSDVQNF